ncbi:LicD family protein [Microbacterium sp. A588]
MAQDNGTSHTTLDEPAEPDLKILQRYEKAILEQVVGICEKYGLTYYISGGTFLGAVRHGGFIPWDDDIDIALPREDYERLISVIHNELPSPYYADVFPQTAGYHYLKIQVRDPRVGVLMTAFPNHPRQSCWIDIFPLDGAPNPGLKRTMWKTKLNFYELLWGLARLDQASTHAQGRSRGKALVMNIGRRLRINRVLSANTWSQRRIRALQQFPFAAADYCFNGVGVYKFKSIFNKQEIYGEGRSYKFEDMDLHGPIAYDAYLTQIYGDYMSLPPVENRNFHDLTVFHDKKFAIGYTQGTFDMFHVGHLRLIEHAKEYCDYLIVGVNSDALVQSYKNKTPVIGENERQSIVLSLSAVDEARIVNSLDKKDALRTAPYQAIFIGDDWAGNDRWSQTQKDLAAEGVSVVFLPYTDGVSSTVLRDDSANRVAE